MKKDLIQLIVVIVFMNMLLNYAHADEQYQTPIIEENFSEHWAEYGNAVSVLKGPQRSNDANGTRLSTTLNDPDSTSGTSENHNAELR